MQDYTRISADDPRLTYAGRWRNHPSEPRKCASWVSASVRFRFSGQMLRLVVGPQTQRVSGNPGGKMIVVNLVFEDGARETKTAVWNPEHAEPLELWKDWTRRTAEVEVILADWASQLEIDALEIGEGDQILPAASQGVLPRNRLLCIGNSITSGFCKLSFPGAFEYGVERAWSRLLGKELSRRGYSVSSEVAAYPGLTLTDLAESMQGMGSVFWSASPKRDIPWTPFEQTRTDLPTVIFISVGTNDAGWGISQDDFSKAYVKFITRIKNECGPSLKHIVAMAPWPSGRNFDSPYEPAFKELIQRTNAEWASEAAVGQQSPVRLYHFPTTNLYWKDETFDGLHPTEAAHEKIADALALWCIDSQTKVVEEGPALSAACSAAR